MPIHREHQILPFTPEQIFDLVADVERYPEFLPLWRDARITRSPGNPDLYLTEQALQLGPVQRRFRTETHLRRPDLIEVHSNDSLFDHFLIRWSFGQAPNEGCNIEFLLRCEASSLLLRPLLDLMLVDAAQVTVRAFERRAHNLYNG